MSTLPANYKEGVTRVTSLVGFVFPFKGTDGERRYLKWLKDKKINPEEYVGGACSMGTEVHEALEHYIETGGERKRKEEVAKEIRHGINWLKSINYKSIKTEIYVCEENDRFQGAVDLLYTDKDGKVVLADWKTYGIVKKRYTLPNKFTVPKSKKDKVRLQMSIYAYGLAQMGIKVDRLELLFLHEDGLKDIPLTLHSPEEIEALLASYEASLNKEEIEIIINPHTMFKIEIRVPTETYGYVNIQGDLALADNGKTSKENIDSMMAAGAYAKQQYKKQIG